jgi:hypothetical protein
MGRDDATVALDADAFVRSEVGDGLLVDFGFGAQRSCSALWLDSPPAIDNYLATSKSA